MESKKLKPAKQYLADAINQSGGWRHGAEYAAQDKCAQVTMLRSKPIRHGNTWLDDEGFDDVGGFGCDKIQNWRHCILSRDEYFTAYPEQVMVENKNETEQKAEVEMKSESEATINASDWHKNVETEIVAHKDGFAIGWCKSVMKGCHGDKAHEFRPLRTERDKAIEDMLLVIHEARHPHESLTDACQMLYAAGYRKEVK